MLQMRLTGKLNYYVQVSRTNDSRNAGDTSIYYIALTSKLALAEFETVETSQ